MAYLDESGVTSLTSDIKALADADYAPYAQGIEYIVGTQTKATNAWTGVTVDSTLRTGKVIAYYLPYAGNSSAATLNLTLAGGTTTGAKALRRTASSSVTTQFAAGNVIIMVYDGTYWKVSAYYDNNTYPTGHCMTAAATAAKSATCTYGYRDDANYFPCLFRYANTAANATLSIANYATTELPIYVNGARTSRSNTFGAGVIMFLYYNNAYYCYNDGRFPIVVDGAVTSVQDALASISGGSSVDPASAAPLMDGTSAVGTSTDYARADHVHPTDTSRAAASHTHAIADVTGLQTALDGKQDELMSGTNIKTVNGTSLLGSGDIATPTYTLPAATTDTLGGVKVDGTTITATDGVISAVGGGGSSNGMLITVNYSSPSYVADKTAQEIYDALEAGVMPVIKVTGAYYPLTHVYVSGTRLELRLEGFAGEFVANTMTDYPTLSGSSGGSND